jgi:hypothetical protein
VPQPPVAVPIKIESPPPKATEPKLPEPTIHVRRLSNSGDHVELEKISRPVIAEQFERHIPKDDLLTPRDVAKAFQLEFGVQTERTELLFDRSRKRRLKVLFSGAGALVIAVAVVWPVVHVVSGRINASPAAADAQSITLQVANADPTIPAVTDARTASDQIAIRHPDTLPAIAPDAHSGPLAEPIIVADSAPDNSSADDPTVLWSNGLDAESAGNYAKAVEAYERIESLPSYSWPPHLQVRLALARKELKGEMH